jgi:16S rRNA processing protein RimM
MPENRDPSASGASAPGPLIRLGRIRRAHGIRGGLRLEYFGEDPLDLKGMRGVCLEPPDGGAPVPAKVLKVKISPPGALVALEGVGSRTEAERLQGFFVSAPRASLPPPAEDEIYQADLIGLPVLASDGRLLGTADGFPDHGGTQLMQVATPGGKTILIPWTDGYISEADPEAGRVVVADAPGLLDQD